MNHQEERPGEPSPSTTFEKGEKVRIIEGPSPTSRGTWTRSQERSTHKVMVTVFGGLRRRAGFSSRSRKGSFFGGGPARSAPRPAADPAEPGFCLFSG